MEISGETSLGQDVDGLFTTIGIGSLDGNIVNLRSYTKGCIGRQSPRCCRPSENIYRSIQITQIIQIILSDFELRRHRCVLHVPVAARLVELVAGETCSGSRRIRLDGVTLVKKVLLVELLEQPPKGFDIFVVVGDVGVFHIHPIAHPVAQVGPLAGVHHYVFAAFLVVLLNADALSDVFLRDAKLFFYAKFNGESVCVPTGFTFHLVALHRLEATESVLDAASQNMMDAWVAVG